MLAIKVFRNAQLETIQADGLLVEDEFGRTILVAGQLGDQTVFAHLADKDFREIIQSLGINSDKVQYADSIEQLELRDGQIRVRK